MNCIELTNLDLTSRLQQFMVYLTIAIGKCEKNDMYQIYTSPWQLLTKEPLLSIGVGNKFTLPTLHFSGFSFQY